MDSTTVNIEGPLLKSNWLIPVVCSILTFIVYEAVIRHNQLYSSNPICNYPEYDAWIWYANSFQAGGFTVVLFMQISHYMAHRDGIDLFGSLITSACVSFLSGLSSIMTLHWNWGGVCQDAFGVRSPGVLWGEWISCVPLIFYIVITTENKPSLTIRDKGCLLFISIGMVLGSTLNFGLSFEASIVVIIIALSSVLISLILLRKPRRTNRIEKYEMIQQNTNSNLQLKQYQLTLNLLILIPTFPIVYFLSLSAILDHNRCAVLMMVCNSSMKILFVSQVLNAHVQVIAVMHAAEVQANEARRAFLRFIMHEVRIPLNSMTMGIQLLGESANITEEDKEALIMMDSAAVFMRETLNDILSIQKIEEGKLELTYVPFLIHEMPIRIKATLSGIAAEKNITLSYMISKAVPVILIGDSFRIEHVITNLVSNAIKFSPRGSEVLINITIQHIIRQHEKNNRVLTCTLVVSVIDHGPGMSEEDQCKLFQPFMQIHPGELQNGGGSGIGLSLCKQIIELHGGTIECSSVVDEGSTFTFKLPLKIGNNLNNNINALSATSPLYNEEEIENQKFLSEAVTNRSSGTFFETSEYISATTSSGKETKTTRSRRETRLLSTSTVHNFDGTQSAFDGEFDEMEKEEEVENNNNIFQLKNKVLIVDDVESNRKLLKMLLVKRGYECIAAQDGQIAVDVVSQQMDNFDLIFMDNMMPNMNGLQATRAIRKLGYVKLIIGLTGNALDDDVTAFMTAGANKVLLKPLKPAQLDAIISHVRQNGPKSIGLSTL